MAKLETNIITPKRNTGKDADLIEDLEIMAQSIQEELNKKTNNVDGKGLSTNDFTNEFKIKLENLENYNDTEVRNLISGVEKDLENYYLKSETYNKQEIDNKISLIPKFDIKVVDKLPTENIEEATVYLVKSGEESNNLYTEYIYADGVWEKLGEQKLDLSRFYNKDEINALLATRDSKIQALENENKSQAERIETLEKENANQAEELEALWKDYKEAEAKGETVSISDGIWRPKITINGNSYQYTTEGYNLLNPLESKSSGYYSFDKDTSILTLNGTIDETGYAVLTNVIGAFSSGEYTIVTEYISGSIENISVVNIGIGSQEWANGGINVSALNSSNLKMVKNVTLGDTNNNLYSQCGVGTYNNFKVRLWVASGTYTLANIPAFEQYTGGQASPNTEYKQDIEVITECSLVQRGKNILQVGNFKKSGLSGIEVTKLAENKFMLNGTSTSSGRILAETFNKISGKQMTLTAKRISGNSVNGGFQILVYIGENSWSSCTSSQNIGQNDKITAQMNEGGINSSTYQLGFFVAEGVTVDNLIVEVQFEYGEESTEIEPPVEPIVHEIDLQGNSIAKVGDIKDLLNIGVDGSVKLPKNTKMRVFDGSENWIYYNRIVYIDIDDILNLGTSVNANLYTNYFKIGSGRIYVGHSTGKRLYINLDNVGLTDITTLAEWKEWLSTHNLEFLYQTDDYKTISLPSIKPITLFEETNIFELETNLGTTMSVTYKVSNKLTNANQDKEIADLKKAILSLGGNI